jgi:HAE1 family hydrophobic/amphiphilic exporter-1
VTLKPAQCASYLRPTPARKNAFYRGFNAVYQQFENIYIAIVSRLVRNTVPMMILFSAVTVGTFWWFTKLPTGFLPVEDQGYAIVGLQLPDAASQDRTREVVNKVEEIFKKTEGVGHWVLIGGQSVLDQTVASNAATFYVRWKPYEERTTPETQQEAIIGHLRGEFSRIEEAIVFAFPPPAIMGLGVAGGFQMQIEDKKGVGLPVLQELTTEMIRDGNGQKMTGKAGSAEKPKLRSLNSAFRAEVPQLYANIDRVKAKSLGVPLETVFSTLQASMGSTYVNDFNLFGRTFQVRIQADQKFRLKPDDIRRLEVRNVAGAMLPLGTIATISEKPGPQIITRYNLYQSSSISGEAATGFSSGQALKLMERMADDKFPSGVGYEWTGMSFQEKRVGSQSIYIFGLAVLLVYLVLAAQYESWMTPAAVILVVPLALLGTVAAVAIRGMDNNIYTQIGIVLIIALASKNAILIVEFARELRAKGESILEASVKSARLRFRPILMTSFAFILGIFPLVNAKGAGAASRQALGTAVFGGMLAATFFAVFFVPVFYVVIQSFSEWKKAPVTTPVVKDSGIAKAVLETS